MSETSVERNPLDKSSPSLHNPAEVSRAELPRKNETTGNSHKHSTDHSELEDSKVKEPKIQEKTGAPAEVSPPTPPPTDTTNNAKENDDLKKSSENNLTPHDDSEESGPLVDMETFGQLLEMDDDEEHSFSKSLTWDYFDQAVTTFKEMDTAVLAGDLLTLSRKGHFLKGSSAALGLNKVKASCEKMQHYGNRKKANGEGALSEFEAMEKCKSLLAQLKEQQKLSKAWLERFYAERNV